MELTTMMEMEEFFAWTLFSTLLRSKDALLSPASDYNGVPYPCLLKIFGNLPNPPCHA